MFITFQDLILKIQDFWKSHRCTILQPYDLPMGAGTLHPATAFSATKKSLGNIAYIQPVRRPSDSRFATHPNRRQHYYQFQVLLNPAPNNFQELYIKSLENINIHYKTHDISFFEDNWQSTTLGAFGLGWEALCNGIEISQLTYMYQIANIKCTPIIAELTYGLERIAMILQEVDNVSDIIWNDNPKMLYKDIFNHYEIQNSQFNLYDSNSELLKIQFNHNEEECIKLIENNLPYIAYEYCINAIHTFNLLDARNLLSSIEREKYVDRTKNLSILCVNKINEQ